MGGKTAGFAGTGFAREARSRGLWSRLRKLNGSHDRLRIRICGRAPGDAARTEWRFNNAVSSILHKPSPSSRESYSSMLAPRYPLFDGKLKIEGIASPAQVS